MGYGYFDGAKLHFVASAEFDLVPGSPDDVAWRTVLEQTSLDLHVATLGQAQFGTIRLGVLSRLALQDAEVLLVAGPGESSGTYGLFGQPGVVFRLLGDAITRPHIAVHELAHHVWNLGEEYAQLQREFVVDPDAPVPGPRTVVLADTLAADELKGGQFYVVYDNGALGRGGVVTNTAHEITLDRDLPRPLAGTGITRGWAQPPASCGEPTVSGASFCIMEQSDAPAVTDFCHAATHVVTTLNAQEGMHGQSCWTTITGTPGFELLVPPPGPAQLPPPDPVTIITLQDSARFALAIDVSGSMQGDKLRYAKAGIAYWLDLLTDSSDRVSVVAFKSQASVVLPLTEAGAGLDEAAIAAALDGLTASGFTNVRDGIREGITQITSDPEVSALQAVVVLTDGEHNRPVGSSVSEALPDLRDNHVKIAPIGLGPVDELDTEELNVMARSTNGFSTFVDTDGDVTEVQTAMIDASQRLLGADFDQVVLDLVPPPPPTVHHVHPVIEQLFDQNPNPALSAVMQAVGAELGTLLHRVALVQAGLGDIFSVRPFRVERGCESITASIGFGYEDRFHLWLLGPRLKEASSTDSNVRVSSTTTHPHRFCTVTDPTPGRWHTVVLRRRSPQPGRDRDSARVRLIVGGRNRHLTAVARTRKAMFSPGETVVVEARADWRAPLSALSVDMVVREPGGRRRRVPLRDGDLLSPEAGGYLCEFVPEKPGRYTALVRFRGSGRARRADGAHRVTHAPLDVAVDLAAGIGPFQRVVPLTFAVLPR